MSARSRARELALKALYAFESGDQEPGKVFAALALGSKLDADNQQFAQRLFDSASLSIADLDQRIAALSEHWAVERMAVIDKNILRLSMTELLHFPDAPVKVCINEAIELAKKYGGAESASFVNGILDRFAQNLPPNADRVESQ